MRLLLLSTAIFIFINSAEARMFERKAKVLFTDSSSTLQENWIKGNMSEEEGVRHLVKLLLKSKTGKKLLYLAKEKAAAQGETLLEVIKVGEGSLTDTTLVRRFSPSNPEQIDYETKTKVFVNQNLNTMDAVLDLAHELTHFTYREPFNPYRQNFKLHEFIHSTVEGKGGEVDAYMIECKVKQELFPKQNNSSSNCNKVTDQETGKLSKKLGAQQFYKVGQFVRKFKRDLERFGIESHEFPYLSEDDSDFISSAYGKPYPIAALEEYVTIMGKACQNDYRRLAVLSRGTNRSPASEGTDFVHSRQSSLSRMKNNFSLRCNSFINTP
ncbi:MAG: hypothetical protein CME70_04145 [Halobacteriovorax sp.]|nr:hypothetical protein [Halobacteriovorax sp.]